MTSLTLTCDQQGALRRVAVWQGSSLRDLYLDRLDKPDLTGAVVGGKIVRVLAGQKAAWLDCGLDENVYAPFDAKPVSGVFHRVRLTGAPRQGKAWTGSLVREELPELTAEKTGVLVPPPLSWQRALADFKDGEKPSLSFADPRDFGACRDWLSRTGLSLAFTFSKEPVHPGLEETIDALLQPTVDLPGGSSLVFEPTEALVSVDVNAGEAGNPLAVNLLAVREAARQLRLRNLAGIIVIDALKMKERADKAKVLNALARAVADDPAGAQVFGLTKLGLIEMTRTRRGPSLSELMRGLDEGG